MTCIRWGLVFALLFTTMFAAQAASIFFYLTDPLSYSFLIHMIDLCSAMIADLTVFALMLFARGSWLTFVQNVLIFESASAMTYREFL